MEVDVSWTFAALCALAFFAGLVDSVIGGGGLIQVPALLVMLPTAPIATVFGTNKIVSVCGTSVALAQIARKVTVPWTMLFGGAVMAAIFAFLGARSVTYIDPKYLKPVILLLLIGVAIYTLRAKILAACTRRNGRRRPSVGSRWPLEQSSVFTKAFLVPAPVAF